MDMKRFIYIFTVAALAASCTNTIELDVRMPDKRLILNSFLRTDVERQVIYLTERTDRRNEEARDGMENVYGAEVTCHVNGELVAVAEELIRNSDRLGTKSSPADPYTGPFGSCYYWFDASFKPGDKVRIEARKGNRTAYAEIVVPEPAKLEVLKMASSEIYVDEYYTMPVLDFDLGIQDVAGVDSYFRLADAERDMDLLFHVKDEDGNKADDVYREFLDWPEIVVGNDPILNDGYMPGSDDGIFASLSPENTFRIFSDSQFKDGKGEVSLSVESSIDSYQIINLVERVESVEVSPTLKIKIESLSFETYNYYKALNAGETFGYEISFLMEPVIFPCNVVGGLGFVGISSAAILEIPLPAVTFEPPIYTY